MESLKFEYLAARDNERKVLIKARKAEPIARTTVKESEQLRSTCDRLRNRRNKLQDELDDMTERHDEQSPNQRPSRKRRMPGFGTGASRQEEAKGEG